MSAELIPELQRLGQRLAEAREAVGLTQQEQAERLRMGTEQLRALEQGVREELPEPVFVIAQARRVAASLGVDIDADIAALRSNAAFQAKQPAPPPRHRASGASGPDSSTGTAATTTTQAPDRGPAASPEQRRRPRPLVLLSALLLALAGGGFWMQRQLQSPTGSAEAERSATVPPPPATAQSVPAQPDPATAELVLTSSAPSWLEVRDTNGLVLYRGLFNGEQRFALSGELRVLAGRPDLVLVSRGAEPALPLGPIESVVWRRFSPPQPPAPAPGG